MCQLLEVSRSGFYAWNERPPSKRKVDNGEILKLAKKSHEESNEIYGIDKILEDVREKIQCGRNRLYGIMKKNGIYSKRPRKYKATTNSKHDLPVAENLLNQDFKVLLPYAVWVTDISYIATDEGWLYLAIVKDLFNKEIVGWSAASRMTRELVIQALKNSVSKHRPPAGIIHHSDGGVQYCSKDYQELLRKNGFKCSMSQKGNYYDNACAETFFSTIKNEMIHLKKFRTREEARRAIFEYIEIFYNRKRRHEALGYLSPTEFTRRYMEKAAA